MQRSNLVSDTSSTPEGAFRSEDRDVKGQRKPLSEQPVATETYIATPRPPSFWQRFGTTMLVAAIVACTVSIGMHLLLMATLASDNRLVQEGKVFLNNKEAQEIFYPVPYAAPPHLELTGDLTEVKITEQKPDRFTIQSPQGGVHIRGPTHWRTRRNPRPDKCSGKKKRPIRAVPGV